MTPRSFDGAPMRVHREVTRACGLACRHLRAKASLARDPDELTTAEGRSVLDQIAACGDTKPHAILTRGDAIERPDRFELIARAKDVRLRISVLPSANRLLTREVVQRLAAAGVHAISLRIDGCSPERHDAMRGVGGCFERTLTAAHATATTSLQVGALRARRTSKLVVAIGRATIEVGSDFEAKLLRAVVDALGVWS